MTYKTGLCYKVKKGDQIVVLEYYKSAFSGYHKMIDSKGMILLVSASDIVGIYQFK